MIVANAVYHDGVLEPSEPLELEEGQAVRLHIAMSSPAPSTINEDSEAEKLFVTKIKATKSLKELFNLIKSAPPSIQAEGDYDIEEAIDESRRLTGFRVPRQEPS